ncbi:putative bifunctional diguanylate cyclase/phosphodiesterase [Motilibacter aurantiacus]|uniref:putative bifunctional diguanylate cyclase/phosphodiesterase n=1 Tax=Motilibacter aurantiacus TaxID=2714955 RepID=UPI00140C9F3B|nr:EAL domain-containing protein [Motilibacter aurantiacus]NHC45717.1 EAL domain-containing protein [Motilibacter aurantiacus]
MSRVGSRGEPRDPRVAAARGAAVFGAVGAVATGLAAATMLHGPSRSYTFALAGLVTVLTVLIWKLPWDRWPHRYLLVIVPVASALIGFGNWASPNPYDASIFFLVLTLWVGATQRRGTTVAVLPVLVAAYWLPLYDVADDDRERHLLTSSLGYYVLIVLVLGELTAYAMARMRRVSAELREHDERRFTALVENASDVTVLLDASGTVAYASPSARSVHGRHPEQMVGLAFEEALARDVHPDDLAAAVTTMRAVLGGGGGPTSLHVRAVDGAGGWREMEWLVADHRADPVLGGVVVTARDVTEQRRLERALREQALHDQLTGLANRGLLTERLQRARGEGRAVAVLYCDVDGFKPVNDRFGHEQGDRALQETARRLVAAAGARATVARLGGDEFAVLLPDAGEEAGLEVGRRLVAAMAVPVELPGSGTARLGVSVGLAAELPLDEDLLVAADIAMYAAKAGGGSEVLAYRPQMRESRADEAALRMALRGALDRDELRLDFAPVLGLATGRLLGVSALVRWDHPVLDRLGVEGLLPEVEASGLGPRLGRWALEEACRALAEARRDDPALADAYVGVGVCGAFVQSRHFAADVRAALHAAGLPPGALVVELGASAVPAAGAVTDELEALAALGVRFALAGFGAQSCSLLELQRLPLALVRTDPGLLAGPEGGAGLLPPIVELGRRLGGRVVAGGVSSADEAAYLRGLGVDGAQGPYVGPPRPLAELRAAAVGA